MNRLGSSLWTALLLPVLACFTPALQAQAGATAVRPLDLQAGGSFDFGRSAYLPYDTQGNPAPLSDLTRTVQLTGFGGYLSADFRPHEGLQLDIQHQIGRQDGGNQTTYQVGGRYIFVRKFSFLPYGCVSYGRGVYSYPKDSATLSFNLYSLSGGLDYHLRPAINLRLNYEWQSWLAVPLRSPNPQMVTLGVAYHFH